MRRGDRIGADGKPKIGDLGAEQQRGGADENRKKAGNEAPAGPGVITSAALS